jgi:5'(3')-deoxyribonucleotidase
MADDNDLIGLIDLDGTVADYDAALTEAQEAIRSPDEPPYRDRYSGGSEPPYVEARRKMIQRQPGFWRNLKRLALGFDVVEELRRLEFQLHVLTKGPQSNGPAWGEKLEWAREHLEDATVTVTGDKSIVYGRVLVDDYSPYFTAWLRNRPRGVVVCVAHPWNEQYAVGGAAWRPDVLRYDGANREEMRALLRGARDREAGRRA